MAKRKLNRRQAWRVQKIQEERLARSERKRQSAAPPSGSELGPEERGRITACYGVEYDVEAADRQSHRCVSRQNIDSLVCGDEVVWQPGSGGGVIVARRERRSLLSRPDFHQKLRPVAANVDQIVVVSAVKPGVSTGLIDRYLVATETVAIPAVIVINKADLLSDEDSADLHRRLQPYRTLGYPLCLVSTRQTDGLACLQPLLHAKTSIFVGQSGVGKSSILQSLLPGEELRVGELSESSGLGRHTTTVTRLYHFPQGGDLIDSPGVRDFALWNVSIREIQWGFVEFRALLGHCRFNDCSHTVEPGCAIIDAAQRGDVAMARLASYQQIVAALQTGWTNATE